MLQIQLCVPGGGNTLEYGHNVSVLVGKVRVEGKGGGVAFCDVPLLASETTRTKVENDRFAWSSSKFSPHHKNSQHPVLCQRHYFQAAIS